MPFDITDAYENIKTIRSEVDLLIQRQNFIMETLKKEGMADDEAFNKWYDKKLKAEVKHGN